ncbi:hypothetical protein HOY80DRAFT_1025108 [Tuber brumale]|nr:hypothetical protein HOY80DRAFT_1025108 [Tuber brumale]
MDTDKRDESPTIMDAHEVPETPTTVNSHKAQETQTTAFSDGAQELPTFVDAAEDYQIEEAPIGSDEVVAVGERKRRHPRIPGGPIKRTRTNFRKGPKYIPKSPAVGETFYDIKERLEEFDRQFHKTLVCLNLMDDQLYAMTNQIESMQAQIQATNAKLDDVSELYISFRSALTKVCRDADREIGSQAEVGGPEPEDGDPQSEDGDLEPEDEDPEPEDEDTEPGDEDPEPEYEDPESEDEDPEPEYEDPEPEDEDPEPEYWNSESEDGDSEPEDGGPECGHECCECELECFWNHYVDFGSEDEDPEVNTEGN